MKCNKMGKLFYLMLPRQNLQGAGLIFIFSSDNVVPKIICANTCNLLYVVDSCCWGGNFGLFPAELTFLSSGY